MPLSDEAEKIIKKKWGKKKIIFYAVLAIFYIISFFLGNFLSNSSFIKQINPFTQMLGSEAVEIDPTYLITTNGNKTEATFKIINSGDKDIENLFINYQFCDQEMKSVNLEERVFRVGEPPKYFKIDTGFLNTSCSPITPTAHLSFYFDSKENCYTKIQSPVSKVCGFCEIPFQVYGNGKMILNKTIGYPYTEINVSTISLVTKLIAMGSDLTLNPRPETGHKPYKLSSCYVIENETKYNITPFVGGDIELTIFDTFTYCLQGTDPEWCASILKK